MKRYAWLTLTAAALVATGLGENARAAFVPRVTYTLGEGADGATGEGSAVVTPPQDSAVWIEFGGANAGIDVDYSTDFVAGSPTWSTDTRGPQSQYSMRLDGNEGASAPFTAWWTSWNPANANFRLGVQAWVKPDPSIQNFGFEIPVLEDLVGIYIDAEGRWRYANNGNLHEENRGTTWDFIDGTGEVAKVRYGQWQHVAARTDGSSWDIYVDGTKVSTTNSNNFTYGGSSFRSIGTDQNLFGDFAGWIDDVQMFWYDSTTNFAADTQFTQELVQGDTNLDGIVNEVDFNNWLPNIGLATTNFIGGGRLALGDVDLNGVVNLADFRIIKANRSAGSEAFAIPEPTSLALIGLALVAVGGRSRRRLAVQS
jgi:hypothetical protein